jgi:hypothetical protein
VSEQLDEGRDIDHLTIARKGVSQAGITAAICKARNELENEDVN